MMRAIMGLAAELGVEVVAEGVETAEQTALLTAMGVHAFKGYYFSRPVATESVVDTVGAMWRENVASR